MSDLSGDYPEGFEYPEEVIYAYKHYAIRNSLLILIADLPVEIDFEFVDYVDPIVLIIIGECFMDEEKTVGLDLLVCAYINTEYPELVGDTYVACDYSYADLSLIDWVT